MLSDEEYEEIRAEAFAEPEAAEELAETAEEVDETPAVSEEESAAQDTSDIETADETEETEDADADTDDTDESADDEIEQSIPTADEINTRFARVPKDARSQMISLADQLRSSTDAVNAIGGDKGVEVFTPLAGIMQKAETTDDERMAAIGSLVTANPVTATEMFADAAETLLASDGLRVIGNKIATRVFGATVEEIQGYTALRSKYENATPEHISDLLTLEKTGYINPEEDMALLREGYGGTELYQQQEEKIRALTEQLQSKVEEAPKAEVPASPALTDFNNEFVKRVEAAVTPAREMGKWDKDSFVATITAKAILADLKDDPDYKAVQKAVASLGSFNPDNLAIHSALNRLGQKARGRYQEAVKNINADLRKRSESSPNTSQVRAPKTVAKPVTLPVSNGKDDDIDAIWAEYDSLVKDHRVAAGRSL